MLACVTPGRLSSPVSGLHRFCALPFSVISDPSRRADLGFCGRAPLKMTENGNGLEPLRTVHVQMPWLFDLR